MRRCEPSDAVLPMSAEVVQALVANRRFADSIDVETARGMMLASRAFRDALGGSDGLETLAYRDLYEACPGLVEAYERRAGRTFYAAITASGMCVVPVLRELQMGGRGARRLFRQPCAAERTERAELAASLHEMIGMCNEGSAVAGMFRRLWRAAVAYSGGRAIRDSRREPMPSSPPPYQQL